MDIVIRGRRAGKTATAVAWCIKNGAIMLVFCQREAKRLMAAYPGLRVMSWDEWRTYKRHGVKPPVKICVDNIDMFISEMLGRVDLATLTAGDA